VSKGREPGISIVGNQGTNIAVGRSQVNVSGPQVTWDPRLVPEVTAKLEEIVRVLEAYREEVEKQRPRRKQVLERLT
jgi:hypothetical protein